MRILLVNDDGINAEGFAVLEKIANALSDDVWAVAPDKERSAVSRAITLHDPIKVKQLGPKRFACSGTPTDCVIIGVLDILKDKKPDLILSGVNRGQNLAEDVTVSGTVAGAVQGMQMGIKSIALSQTIDFSDYGPACFEVAEKYSVEIIKKLLNAFWPPTIVMNVNFPMKICMKNIDEAIIEATSQGAREEDVNHVHKREDLRGSEYYWLGYNQQEHLPPLGTDLRAVMDGNISITPLHIDLTSRSVLNELAKDFVTKLEN